MRERTGTIRLTLYRGSDSHLDLKVVPGARFAAIRLWRGRRWPNLERVWRARMRRWIPWFSPERQILRALQYIARHSDVRLTRLETERVLGRARDFIDSR